MSVGKRPWEFGGIDHGKTSINHEHQELLTITTAKGSVSGVK